jgi:hypothetical protein
MNHALILRKEKRLMATATLTATLNTPISVLRPATIDRILVIEEDAALRKILQRLFLSEGHEVDVVPDAVCGLEILQQRGRRSYLVSGWRPSNTRPWEGGSKRRFAEPQASNSSS